MANAFPFADNKPYASMALHMRQMFGGRIQKISVNAGFSCPNRDESKGKGGCTYCNNEAFTPSYCTATKPIKQQIAEGIEFHRVRYRRAERFLVYFQSYSNTHSPSNHLKTLWEEALSVPGVIGLVISTRPDCLDEERMQLLASIAETKYIQLEIGIESMLDSSLERINRQHSVADTISAFALASKYKINTGGHVILGLPGESREQTLEMAQRVSELPIHSIKLHQLQIVRGTRMEMEYKEKSADFELFGLPDYIDFVVSFCERLRPDIFIERFASEVPPRYLVAPEWGMMRYDQVLGLIEKRFEEKESWQGKKWEL